MTHTEEQKRLQAHRQREANWRLWGPYLSERAWGTVREDYSPHGSAWEYFPFDHAHLRAYRWNEDGLLGFCDRFGQLSFALALWNEQDAILKERLFGLSGPEGNHGEDVKEIYYYLDNTPTHRYARALYRYPQRAFPYEELRQENAKRGLQETEYELTDTGIFDENRYFDVTAEYAKAAQDDLLIRVTIENPGPDEATLHLLPSLWFRNTWSWGYPDGPLHLTGEKPRLSQEDGYLKAEHDVAGNYHLYAQEEAPALFTENETNYEALFGSPNRSPYTKDAFHRYVIAGEQEAVNPAGEGTKAALHYRLTLKPHTQKVLCFRLSKGGTLDPFEGFGALFERAVSEADAFYETLQAPSLTEDERRIQRQALAGMLWTKQLYYYDIPQWLQGDPGKPTPPEARLRGRNHEWQHLHNFDVISMPDKWEFPWYATWDLAFHCLPLAMMDVDYAKRQLELVCREWYMHPNGQIPAYEWHFDDVNPPVHAWAVLRVYEIEQAQTGAGDRPWLEALFQKLLLNFTWWVNRKDKGGNNIFQGGFLGLDNIGVFDRSGELPVEGHIDQSDGTAWMAAYALTMVRIALELAKEEPHYQDSASKFMEHFLRIADSMIRGQHYSLPLWDEEDGFFYDILHPTGGEAIPLKVRSLVGILPLFAVKTLGADTLKAMPDFKRRMDWFMQHRPEVAQDIVICQEPGVGGCLLLSLLTRERLRRVLERLLDEDEFLSPYGVRSVSKYHEAHPYVLELEGETHTVAYNPGESDSHLFGGNSNWRGPVWFPINYLIIESLQTYGDYYGEGFRIECPTGSGRLMTLHEVATELSQRLVRIFRDENGHRAVHGGEKIYEGKGWHDKLLFYEYFHGETGAGLGASHQTGWTGLVATLLHALAAQGEGKD